MQYVNTYHPICQEHGERPTTPELTWTVYWQTPRIWQVQCDVCGAWTNTFQRRLERVATPLPELGEPHLAATF